MNQHIHLGNALYERYVTQEKFLGKSLNYWEMYIRSTDVNRTLISAYSNLIGMYYGRTEAEPNKNYPNNTRWPGQLVPFPVHSVARDTDYAGDPLAPNCPRLYWLLDKSKETPEYIKLRNDSQKFLDWLTEVCGEEVDLIRLWDIRDATFIEVH
ncbi:unnamed protein product [Anisakis simplex]|uniref:acid phosphatase n=1 Tax=Anisakis simplex TaxID=6269 RepID=A0A0M3KGP6_ANISI|nr:unnamed protein product [Anisakis simplex]